MNATTQLGEVTSLKTGIRLRRLSVNVWKFGRRTARPVFSLSAFKPCVEILPARIGMVFGSSWRNREARPRRSESGIQQKQDSPITLRLIFRRGGNGFVFAIRL